MPQRTILALSVFLTCITGCTVPEKEPQHPVSRSSERNLPAQESWNVTLILSESGRQQASIHAGHAAEYHEEGKKRTVADKGITVSITDRQGGRQPTIMTAGRAVIHDNQDIEAFDNVVIRSGNGTVVRTDSVIRTDADHMLRSKAFVTIERPGETIRGNGFESDDNMKQYRIFKASGESVSH